MDNEGEFFIKSKKAEKLINRHSEEYIWSVNKGINVKSSNRNEFIMGKEY